MSVLYFFLLLLFSHQQQCLTLCDHMDCRSPGFPVSHHLLKFPNFISIDQVMPSNHFILCCPLLLLHPIFPRIRFFPNELAVRIRWPKYWSFTFSNQSFHGILGDDFLQDELICSLCCPRDSQESSPAPQFESINSSALCHLYCPALTSIHDYWKDHRLEYMDLHLKSDLCFLAHCLVL